MKPEPEPIRRILSSNIKKYRSIYQYSQEKLAEKAGLSAQTLNDIEGCRRWVSAATITKLAKALNISEYQLFVPEKELPKKKTANFNSLKSLLTLQKKVKKLIDAEFENAVDTGHFL